MRLPNNKNAVIDSEKITGYALSRDHAVGKHKARVFESVLGMSDNGRSAPIRTSWIVRAGEGFPRLTSVYIRTKLLPL